MKIDISREPGRRLDRVDRVCDEREKLERLIRHGRSETRFVPFKSQGVSNLQPFGIFFGILAIPFYQLSKIRPDFARHLRTIVPLASPHYW